MNRLCHIRSLALHPAFVFGCTALALFTGAIARAESPTPSSADLLLRQAIEERQSGDKDAALAHLEQATKLSPERPDILFQLGTLAGELSGPRRSLPLAYEARDSLEKVLTISPNDKAARSWLIGFYSGAPFFAGGSMKKAHKHAEILATQDPWAGFYWKNRLLLQEKDYDKALKLCDAMLAKAPTSTFVRYQFGLTCATSGQRLSEGQVALESCLQEPAQPEQPPRDQICLQLGLIDEKLGDRQKALAAFEQGLVANPNNPALAEGVKRLR